MGFIIRRIAEGDAAALREVRLAALLDAPYAFAAGYDETADQPDGYWDTRVAAGAAGGDNTVFLAEVDGLVVGMVGGFRPDPGSGDRQLFGLWVAPEARRTGLGARLVEQICQWASESGARRVMLWVTESNRGAIDLYRQCGFSATGVRQNLPSDPTLVEQEMVRTL